MIRIIVVGRLRDGPEAALFDRYAARLRPKPDADRGAGGSWAPAEVKRREGAALLAALPDPGFCGRARPGGRGSGQRAPGGIARAMARLVPPAVFPDRRRRGPGRLGHRSGGFRAVAGEADLAAFPRPGDAGRAVVSGAGDSGGAPVPSGGTAGGQTRDCLPSRGPGGGTSVAPTVRPLPPRGSSTLTPNDLVAPSSPARTGIRRATTTGRPR